ncbi:MAG: helix-turn-helix domain-containing protein [Candidatus Buchananbacteria bacterium]
MAVQEVLRKIGLNDKEIKIYLSLLKNGKATPATLSKLTKINRATVYNVAQSLQSKGIVAEDLTDKVLYFSSLPPQNLEQIVERPRRELKAKELLIKKAIDDLSLITADKNYPVPKIRFVEEGDLENFLYDNTEKWLADVLKSDGIWWGFQDDSLVKQYKAWVDWYWKTPLGKKCQMRMFSNSSEVEQEMKKKYPSSLRDIHYDNGLNFTSSVWVGGDYLIMIVTRQHPFYLFEVHDATLAHNMREVFKKLIGNQ